jgi:hypothetical protein
MSPKMMPWWDCWSKGTLGVKRERREMSLRFGVWKVALKARMSWRRKLVVGGPAEGGWQITCEADVRRGWERARRRGSRSYGGVSCLVGWVLNASLSWCDL